MSSSDVLQGVRVLVLRPEVRGRGLVNSIEAKGGKAWQLSMLEIRPLFHEKQTLAHEQQMKIHSLDQYHKVICISVTAASLLLEQIDRWWPQLPVGIEWYGIGPATIQCLEKADIPVSQAVCDQCDSDQFDSEAMLSLDVMQQVSGQRILLACGCGGRTLLQDQLKSRGADVQRLELYERYCPSYETGEVEQLIALRQINSLVATSSEIVSNLLHYFNPEHSSDCRLLVPGARTAALAEQAGFKNIVVAEGADDASMIRALQKTQNL